MQKIISLFKRDYEGTRQVYDEIVPGCEWVIAGEGVATLKIDGTCCMVRDGILYKRYDRKMSKAAMKRKKDNPDYEPKVEDYKPAPDGWEAAEAEPNKHTGHWPGWVLVGDGPEDRWHREAYGGGEAGEDRLAFELGDWLPDGTYELCGPKVQGNPYNLDRHTLHLHGSVEIPDVPRDFGRLKEWFKNNAVEGIVWHHPDGRMVKIKRRDFGYDWPEKLSDGN